MTAERIEQMRKGREQKEAARVKVELPSGWVLSSYEYGWMIEKGGKQFFYRNPVDAIYSASSKEVSTSGAKSITAIGAKLQGQYSGLREAAEQYAKTVIRGEP